MHKAAHNRGSCSETFQELQFHWKYYRMKNKMKRKEFSWIIINSQFITESPLVKSDCGIYWSAGNLLESLLFFLCMLGDAQVLKKNGILGSAGIGVK